MNSAAVPLRTLDTRSTTVLVMEGLNSTDSTTPTTAMSDAMSASAKESRGGDLRSCNSVLGNEAQSRPDALSAASHIAYFSVYRAQTSSWLACCSTSLMLGLRDQTNCRLRGGGVKNLLTRPSRFLRLHQPRARRGTQSSSVCVGLARSTAAIELRTPWPQRQERARPAAQSAPTLRDELRAGCDRVVPTRGGTRTPRAPSIAAPGAGSGRCRDLADVRERRDVTRREHDAEERSDVERVELDVCR